MIFASLFVHRFSRSTYRWLATRIALPLQQFARSTSGATSMEYAVVLALIAATLVLGGQAMHGGVERSFVVASSAIQSAMGESSSAVPSGSTAIAVTSSATIAALESWLQVAAWASLILATIVAIYARYRNARLARAVQTVECAADSPADCAENPGFSKRQEIQRLLRQSMGLVGDHAMKVQHVMSQRILSVTPHVLVSDLQESLRRAGFRHLLVLRSGQLVGVISDRDIQTRTGRTSGDIMSRSPISVTSETSLSQAVSIMLNKRISCLPVVDGTKLRGILTTTDAIITLQCLLRLIDQEQEKSLKQPECGTLPDLVETREPAVIGALSIASHLAMAETSSAPAAS